MAALIRPSSLILLVLLSVSAVLLLLPVPEGMSPQAWRAAGAILLAISLWATAALPEYLTAVLFFFVCASLGIAKPEVIFAGFHSAAVWLVFGGLVLGLAVQRSGLGTRAVALALSRLHGGRLTLLYALALAGLLLSFIIPSAMGRVMLMIPIVLALSERLGFSEDSNGRIAMVMAATLGTTMPAFAILPANVPNMGLIGGAESIYGITFTYGSYLFLNFTVMGSALFLIGPLLVHRMLPDEAPRRGEVTAPGALSRDERRLLLILLATVALWATDFLHHISPAWVGLGAAILVLFPRIGVVPATEIRAINFAPWIFVAGVIGLGALASQSGVAAAAGQTVLEAIPLAELPNWLKLTVLYLISLIVGLLTGLPAAPGVMTPLANSLAQATGWPLETVLLMQVPGWLVFPFSYQAPPLVIALAAANIRPGRVAKLFLAQFAIGLLLVLPLQYLWGSAIGWYP